LHHTPFIYIHFLSFEVMQNSMTVST